MDPNKHGLLISNGANIVSVCDNCGNQTHQKSITGFGGASQYRVYQCDICGVAILFEINDMGELSQLWPPSSRLPVEFPIPDRIRQLYNEAKLVEQRSPSSFAIQIGRALEAMAKEQKAEGNSLNKQVDSLIKRGVLPETIGQMVHLQRILRNLGAHDAGVDVDKEDARILDDFFNAVVDYVYIAPTKVKRLKEKLDKKFPPKDDSPSSP